MLCVKSYSCTLQVIVLDLHDSKSDYLVLLTIKIQNSNTLFLEESSMNIASNFNIRFSAKIFFI